ncbi:MAG: hypothetical protein K6E73_03095 [Bacteroidales bacterium]|nr:hypothetical protein [Bacteroidales bacterium]
MKNLITLCTICLTAVSAMAVPVKLSEMNVENRVATASINDSLLRVLRFPREAENEVRMAARALTSAKSVASDDETLVPLPAASKGLLTSSQTSSAIAFNGSGTWSLNSTSLGESWTSAVIVRNDTAFVQNLVPFSATSKAVVYGVLNDDGNYTVPKQKLAADASQYILFAAFSSDGKPLDTFEMKVTKTTLTCNEANLGFALYSANDEFKGFYSLYSSCQWSMTPAFTYNATSQAPSASEAVQEASWTSRLYYGESGKFTDGEEVTLVNPVSIASNRTYECTGTYRDGKIYVAPQYIGGYYYNGASYGLWLSGADGSIIDHSDYLRFNVGQDGHLLSLDNDYAIIWMKKGVYASTPVDLSQVDFYLSCYNTINLADDQAVIHTNPLASTYYGYGSSTFDYMPVEWTTTTDINVATGEITITNLFPVENMDGWKIKATYDEAQKRLVIPNDQYIYKYTENGETIYAIFGVTNVEKNAWIDKIELPLSDDGSFVSGNCLVGMATSKTPTLGNVGEFAELFNVNVEWNSSKVLHKPAAAIACDNLVLHWSVNNDFTYTDGTLYGLMAADAGIRFRNCTPSDTYDSVRWTVPVYAADGTLSSNVSSTDETVVLATTPFGSYGYPTLRAINDAGATTVSFPSGDGIYSSRIYAGGNAATLTGGSAEPFLMRAVADGTPLEAKVAPGSESAKTNGIVRAFFYQGKPGNPLYFEGIDILGHKFSATDVSSAITCRIRACHRTGQSTLELGDVLYTAQVAAGNAFVKKSDEGYGILHFDNFSQTVEGMTYTVDYLQVNEEFLVELEWADNDKVSFVPFSDFCRDSDAPFNTFWTNAPASDDNAKCKYFENTARNNVWVSFVNAMYGYLHVEGSHTFNVPAQGGSVDVVVYPFVCDEGSGNRTTELWLADDSEPVTLMWDDEEYREQSWLKAEIVSENYADNSKWNFTLRLTADALPTGSTGRCQLFSFEQRGARLDVEIVQGDAVSGISRVVVKKRPVQLYNLSGQPVESIGNEITVGRKFKAVVR